jgi:hypothetical protein
MHGPPPYRRGGAAAGVDVSHRARHLACLDHVAPQHPLRLGLVVPATEDADAVTRLAAERHRDDMVELEEAHLLAPPAVLGDERALHAIARHRLAPRRPRLVPLRLTRLRRPRPLRLAELPRLDLVEERIERAVQHLGQVSRRHLVAEERLRPHQLVLDRLADRELERELLGRERRHLRRLLLLPGWFWSQ